MIENIVIVEIVFNWSEKKSWAISHTLEIPKIDSLDFFVRGFVTLVFNFIHDVFKMPVSTTPIYSSHIWSLLD